MRLNQLKIDQIKQLDEILQSMNKHRCQSREDRFLVKIASKKAQDLGRPIFAFRGLHSNMNQDGS